MEGVGDAQTQGTQSRITGGDGQDDNAQQSDDAARIAQDVLADHTDGTGGQRGVDLLQAQVVNAHGAGSPDHGDEAFQDHHVVEGHAALTHGTGDDSGLGGVEAGEDAAGHGDEEDGDEVVGVEILTIAEGYFLAGSGIHSPSVKRNTVPVVPQVQQRIAMDKEADKHTQGREQEDGAEDGIDAADDGIDGEHGGDQIIDKACR